MVVYVCVCASLLKYCLLTGREGERKRGMGWEGGIEGRWKERRHSHWIASVASHKTLIARVTE